MLGKCLRKLKQNEKIIGRLGIRVMTVTFEFNMLLKS